MKTGFPRMMLGAASLLSAVGGTIHAASFATAARSISASNLPPVIGGGLKALWLCDSATLFLVAVLFALIAARPAAATRIAIWLIALIPGTTAVVIYIFLGSFFAGHLLMLIAALGIIGGALFPHGAALQLKRTAID